MRVVHIPARQHLNIQIPEEVMEKTPDHLALFTPVQHIAEIDDMKEQLEEDGKKVELLETRHTWNPGQILGCDNEHYDTEAKAFLYVGDGVFHPKALLMKNDKPVYCYNPREEDFFELEKSVVEPMLKRVKAARATFFMEDNIGVLVTTKTGQRGLKYKWAKALEEKYEDKNFYYFMQNNINFEGLNNFPFIDVWLNTACERIAYDDSKRAEVPILNVEDVDDEIVEKF